MPRSSFAQVGFVLLCVLAGSVSREPHRSRWLDAREFYRAMASLPPSTKIPSQRRRLQHARYMVLHDEVRHSEDRRDAWADARRGAAAAVSNLAG